MEQRATPSGMEQRATPSSLRQAVADGLGDWWWAFLIGGIAWTVIGLVVLQFDSASVTTVGVLIGIMFLLLAVQQFAIAAVTPSLGWLWALFGVGFVVAGVIALISPGSTFAALADVLGFLFLLVGTWWIIEAFVESDWNDLWWLTLIAGTAMVVLAFWTSGQLFITKVYVLLVFAGIWALMQGVTDIVRAFQIRDLRDEIKP